MGALWFLVLSCVASYQLQVSLFWYITLPNLVSPVVSPVVG